jgi:hypothetical protein
MGQTASTAYEGVKSTVTTAAANAKKTLGVAGVPDEMTSTPSATNTFGTGGGDTMLGGRRRKGKKSLKGGRRRKSKKTLKHQ